MPRNFEMLKTSLTALAIALIGISAFHVFTWQRGSRVASCMSNERQLGLAVAQYAEDDDQGLPVGIERNGIGWAGTIRAYVKGTDVFHCPADSTTACGPATAISYGLNANVTGREFDEWSRRTVLGFEIAGDCVRLDEQGEGKSKHARVFSAVGNGTDGSLTAGDDTAVSYATGYVGDRPRAASGSQFDIPEGRHQGGADYLFEDGHVKWLFPAVVSSGADALRPNDPQTGGIVGRAAGTESAAYKATFSTK